MKIIEIDGKSIKKDGHKYLKKVFNFPDYYGNNLDALYDCLTDIGAPTDKNQVSWDMIDTFIDASEANSFLNFIY